MTHFLSSDTNPDGYKLETILSTLRADVILRCGKIAADEKTEAKKVLANNLQILQLLTQAIDLAENSTQILDKSFGPSKSATGGKPRIGT